MKKLLITLLVIGGVCGKAKAVVYPIIPVSVPSGSMFMWAGSTTAPSGFFICDGSTVSQTTYSALFSAIGTTWNTGGEGIGNFRLPNMAGVAPYGPSAGTPYSSIGTVGGSTTTASVSVSGTVNVSGTTFGPNKSSTVNHTSNIAQDGSSYLDGLNLGVAINSGTTTSAHSHSFTGTGVNTLTGTATTLSPFAVVEFIIKT